MAIRYPPHSENDDVTGQSAELSAQPLTPIPLLSIFKSALFNQTETEAETETNE